MLTNKGLAAINLEMKDKLIIKLNDLMKKPGTQLDELVRGLVTLSQRSANEPDLLKSAKENAAFTLKDLEDVRKRISEQKVFLEKMDSIISTQIQKLEELNFNDYFEADLNEKFAKRVVEIIGAEKIAAEVSDEALVKEIRALMQKHPPLSFISADFNQFVELLQKYPSAKVNLYFLGIKVVIHALKARCYGQHKDLKKIEY
jgi:hypothetical protein